MTRPTPMPSPDEAPARQAPRSDARRPASRGQAQRLLDGGAHNAAGALRAPATGVMLGGASPATYHDEMEVYQPRAQGGEARELMRTLVEEARTVDRDARCFLQNVAEAGGADECPQVQMTTRQDPWVEAE